MHILFLAVIFHVVSSCGNSAEFASNPSDAKKQKEADAKPEEKIVEQIMPAQEVESVPAEKEPARSKLGETFDPNSIEANVDIVPPCESDKVTTEITTISFPFRQGCAFGVGENQPILANSIRAYASDQVEIKLNTAEEAIEICELKLESNTNAIQYDDFLFLAVNKSIIASSSTAFTSLFPTDGTKYSWNFSAILNQPFSLNNNVPYCLGGETCMFPPTDTVGGIKVELGNDVLKGFAGDLTSGSLIFETITTGDDEPDDCHHSAINLTMEILYAPTGGIVSPLD